MDKYLYYNIFSSITISLLTINAILFFKNYRTKPVAFKIYAFYLLLLVVVELASGYMRHYNIPNLQFSHVYFSGQFILLSIFFYSIISKRIIKKVIKIYTILTLGLLVVYFIKSPDKINSFSIFEVLMTSIPLIIYSFIFFIEKVDSVNKNYIYVSSGLFLYITCSTLLFSLSSIEDNIKIIIWYVNVFLYLIYQVLIFIEWYKNFRLGK